MGERQKCLAPNPFEPGGGGKSPTSSPRLSAISNLGQDAKVVLCWGGGTKCLAPNPLWSAGAVSFFEAWRLETVWAGDGRFPGQIRHGSGGGGRRSLGNKMGFILPGPDVREFHFSRSPSSRQGVLVEKLRSCLVVRTQLSTF